MKKIIVICTLIIVCFRINAQPRPAQLFQDGMVLQRHQPIPVWGMASPGESISIEINGTKLSGKADSEGKWFFNLSAMEAGGPYQLSIKGNAEILIKDVYVGEVWLCSGQSNMEWPVNLVNNAAEEIAAANYPLIRHFTVPKKSSLQPLTQLDGGEWVTCSPQTVGRFTAVGYFFARKLWQELKVPIGLIHSSIGGTHIETWTSKKAFEQHPDYTVMIAKLPTYNLDENARLRLRQQKDKIKSFQGKLPGKDMRSEWSADDLNTDSWPKMQFPGIWEEQGFPDIDGTLWFRKDIQLTAEQAASFTTLSLGRIDDTDTTFINGVLIGGKERSYNEVRTYPISAKILKPGKNNITVKIIDYGGGGGMVGDKNEFFLGNNKEKLALHGNWAFRVQEILPNKPHLNPNQFPTLLFNAMIHPLIPYAIKGAIWYQGESNASRAVDYKETFPLMIRDWRDHWNRGNFPFYFVQLANWIATKDASRNSTWAELREAQTQALQLPATGMAVTIDIGDSADIHPRNKQDVGQRLALHALADLYGKDVVKSGPLYQSMQIKDNRIELSFSFTGSGLVAKGNSNLKGFTIAGSDKNFHVAKALIEGNKIVVYRDGLTNPVAVRYGWLDNPTGINLYNKEGLPASPFRTDNWELLTEGQKFQFND